MWRRARTGMVVTTLGVCLFACNGPPTASDSAPEELGHPLETLTGAVAATLNKLIRTSHASALNLPQDAAYDPQTGWWSFTVGLGNGQTGEVELQFQDGSGQIERVYHPETTERVRTKGRGTGPSGSFTWDLVLTGVQASSDRVVANGSGTFASQTASATYTVNDVVVPKASGAYPVGGNVTVEGQGMTLRVEFNGTATVPVTYTLGGLSFRFTINLDTGEVTRS